MKSALSLFVGVCLCISLAGPATASPPAAPPAADISYRDADRDGRDSPGDELTLSNPVLTLRFLFADLATPSARVDPKFNGWYLDSITYRGEKFFQHPDRLTRPPLYPAMIANDAVGMTAFVRDGFYPDDPFLWLWNAREPRNPGWTRWFSPLLQSYEWYTLYERHAEHDGALVFSSTKMRGLSQEIAFALDGPRLRIRYSAANTGTSAARLTGIVTLPMNRILDTVFTPPDLKVTRKITPAAFSDNYTCRLAAGDGLGGSGMLFWARGKASLLHLDGLLSWHRLDLDPGQAASRAMTVLFLDQNIDQYYREYLAAARIAFDPLDWDDAEANLAAMVPAVIMPEGYIYHTYDYNPPGTNRDWHNEMTGRALVIQHLATGGREWLDYATRANDYYLDRMYYHDPNHPCYGLFRDQTWADKLTDCFPWSQPYNVESLIAEYAVTRDERLRQALLTHFDRMYAGPIWNEAGGRWYWRVGGAGGKDDFGTFDSLEFGADDMISAYEFTGERKYLERAVAAVNRSRSALDNFGLLLEDRAGETSVNTFAFAAKLLFKLYEYTGDEYWRDRAVRILNAALYSRVFMEPWPEEDRWLNGALSRKDGDWRGQFGVPTTGTDSSVPSQTSFIPWVNEALVAGYNHTGNDMYLKYMAQLLHHQLEANRRLAELTGGRAIACGHYNMYTGKFKEDNDGLTVVSNLFLFPYVKVFERGVRSPHSSVVLLPGPTADAVRAFHLSGRSETVTLVLAEGVRVKAVTETENDGRIVGPAAFKATVKDGYDSVSFPAAPYRMYLVDLQERM
jgi:hypothetical protein